MRTVLLLLAAMALGCPDAIEDRGDRVLFSIACTRTSRLAAALNCGPGQFDCKQSLLKPEGCAESTLSTRRADCSDAHVRDLRAELTTGATVDVDSPYWREFFVRSVHSICEMEHQQRIDEIIRGVTPPQAAP
jgi:hypothetical protein